MIFFLIILIILIIYFKNVQKKQIQLEEQQNIENLKTVIEPEYLKSEDQIIEDIIKQELKKNNYDGNDIKAVERKILRLTIIFSILNFIFISLIFFHLPKYVYLLEVINVWGYLSFTKKYNTVQYIKKELKARPDDEISDIVSSIIASGTVNKNRKFTVSIPCIVISTLLPLLIFINPIIFYEPYEDGYSVRFYAVGLSNLNTITIPETHNGRPVLGIRGDAFANLSFLEKVNLPDTIKEIRGKAFKNDKRLADIKLPKNLTYLGGGAFKNCKSLKSITIPKGVTEINGETFVNCESLDSVVLHDDITSIHGETFINCISLREINLPSKITEIRGNTFQYCTSLRKIDIPTGVVRIGGHAFEGCSDLEEVNLPSTLKEIGSSAFRECSSLYEITIPKNTTSIAENAFKDSPTNKNYDGVGRNIRDVYNSNYTKKQNTIFGNNTTNNTSQDIINQTQDINKRMNNSLNNLYKNKQ